MRRFSGSWIFIIIILLIDLYVFQAVKLTVQTATLKIKFTVYGLYWAVSAVVVLTLAVMPYINLDNWPKSFRT